MREIFRPPGADRTLILFVLELLFQQFKAEN
jgi:hypothetical protein